MDDFDVFVPKTVESSLGRIWVRLLGIILYVSALIMPHPGNLSLPVLSTNQMSYRVLKKLKTPLFMETHPGIFLPPDSPNAEKKLVKYLNNFWFAP